MSGEPLKSNCDSCSTTYCILPCAKKYDASAGLWQARVNRNWRFYFTISGDAYVIEEVIGHPK